jgi:CRISPR-associated protein Cmr2
MERMTDAILIFTFSPIQPFIAEARRAADLFVGSRILTQLAQAAGKAIEEKGTLIYPADLNRDDVPNKLVARVPFDQAQPIAESAKKALLDKWVQIAQTARQALAQKSPAPDDLWNEIWERQVAHIWEIYWAAARDPGDYKVAFAQASQALDATKRTRAFEPVEEPGVKDSLSGRRAALRTAEQGAEVYWTLIGKGLTTAKLRPDGRERLDAIGAIKRFSELAERAFPSVSSVAVAEFLDQAIRSQSLQLPLYRQAVEDLLQDKRYPVRDDRNWPYDGDLLFSETLERKRLQDSYGLDDPDPRKLAEARSRLRDLYEEIKQHPSPYYAIIVLDGDGMGERVSQCPDQSEHRRLSEQLAEFTRIVKAGLAYPNGAWGLSGTTIYNGGDDVVALAPLAKTVTLATKLADEFAGIANRQGTASAGIAIAHHLYPLDAALRAAREAEKQAKAVKDKAAVCVRVLKRSGETLEVRSKWDTLSEFDKLVQLFKGKELSSHLAYDVLREARVVTALDDKSARTATLKRLVKRHKTDKLSDAEGWVDRLRQWADALDGCVLPDKAEDGKEIPQGFAELGRWLVLARFVAQGGGE